MAPPTGAAAPRRFVSHRHRRSSLPGRGCRPLEGDRQAAVTGRQARRRDPVRPGSQSAVGATSTKIECRIEQATEADLDTIVGMRVPQAEARPTAKEAFLKGMRTGECCFVARVDGEISTATGFDSTAARRSPIDPWTCCRARFTRPMRSPMSGGVACVCTRRCCHTCCALHKAAAATTLTRSLT